MLRKDTVSAALQNTLEELMKLSSLSDHRLVGGTSLTLQIGHRLSVDIDLFSSRTDSNYDQIYSELVEKFQNSFVPIARPFNGIRSEINGIKVDIVEWGDRWIKKEIVEDHFRLASKEDIIAMKINIFCGDFNADHPQNPRYEKKDFVDIATLLKEFSLGAMIHFFTLKYPKRVFDDRIIIERMSRYCLAENTAIPIMLNGQTWDDVKKIIGDALSEYVKGERSS